MSPSQPNNGRVDLDALIKRNESESGKNKRGRGRVKLSDAAKSKDKSKKESSGAAEEADDAAAPKKKKSVVEEDVYDVDRDKAEREAAKQSAESRSVVVKEDEDEEPDDDALDMSDDKFFTRLSKMSTIDIIKTLWPYVAGAVLFIIVGVVLHSCTTSPETAPVDETRKVDNIDGAYSILDNVDSLKDDQILSLRKQLGGLRESNGAITKDEVAGLNQLNADVTGNLDRFMSAVLDIKANATATEMATHQKNLADYMSPGASTSTLYDFINGSSPARQLGKSVTKSGPVVPSWIASSPEGVRTYQLSVPIVSESGAMTAMYTVTVNKGGKVDDAAFNGVMVNSDIPIEGALSKQIIGDPEQSGTSIGSGSLSGSSSSGRSGSGHSGGSGSYGSGSGSDSGSSGSDKPREADTPFESDDEAGSLDNPVAPN